jgi:hypothetical protein
MIAQLDVSALAPTQWTREDVEDVTHELALAAERLGLVAVVVTTRSNWDPDNPACDWCRETPAQSEASSSSGGWDAGE